MNEKKKMQPKVRFREFTGENASDWKQRKFIDIVERLNKTEDNVKLPRIEFEDIVSGEGRLNKDLNTKKDDRKGIFFDENNILYGKLRPYLRKWYYARFAGIAIGDFWVLKIINNNYPLFIYYLIQTESYQKVANDTSGTKMPRSNWKKVSESLFYIPNINEQQKTSTIFITIDNLITLHQRKLEQLEQLKNTLLSKMFPKSGTNIPEIRFSGFTDAWKHHKLGNTIEKNSLRNKDLLINNVESVSNKYGFIRQTEQFDDYTVASNDLSNYYIILEKFFAYNPSRINVGSIAYKTAGSPVSIVSPLYVSFSTKDMVDDRFLWYWFKTNEFKQQREKYSEGGVRDTLSYNQLSKMNILLPELNEQIKIGKYLDSLTKTIAIHQRKLDQLKNLKQTLLNKMFI